MRVNLLRLLALAAACACLAPATAGAQLVITPIGTGLEVLNAAGEVENRAGAHPDLMRQSFKIEDVAGGPEEKPKDLVIEMPPGLSGNIGAVPFCPKWEAREGQFNGKCPAESQIGTLAGKPIYNVTPGPNQLAEFVVPSFFPLALTGQLRGSDQAMVLSLNQLPAAEGIESLSELKIELWGIPADHQEGTSIPRRAFLTLPTKCGSPLSSVTRLRTWQQPERWISQESVSSFSIAGCGDVPFAPATGVALSDSRADAPSGATIGLDVPQDENPNGRASSTVKEISVLLPEGMTVSPGGASGRVACSDEQIGIGTDAAPTCPAASRVGSIEMAAAGLGSEPIVGAIYLGAEHPGERLRTLVAANVRGTEIKFAGSMAADMKTGQLTTRLDDLPQLPLESMTMRFDGGPGALLATPLSCGPAKTTATFTPYSGTGPVTATASVSIDAANGASCSGQPPFSPSFAGGSTSALAGRPTSFRSLITRRDGEQLPAGTEVTFPPGISAKLGAIATCANADVSRGSCDAKSRVGTAVAELGPGPDPAQVKGGVFLTGPYRGQPFGLALAFGGQIGPLDLGTMVVRGALRIDPQSGQLSAAIESLPRLFEGIAVRFQTIALNLDRPGFLTNPTSCSPSSIVSTVTSVSGQLSRSEVPFKIGGCVRLPFKPRFSIALEGDGQLREGGKPALRVGVGLPGGGANLRSADISLPTQLQFDGAGPDAICSRRAAIKGRCPAGSRVGSASAVTPSFAAPLKGGVYVAQPRGGGQPDIWTHLEGGGVSLDMRSGSTSKDGQLHTKLSDLPDFPVSKLRLSFNGGKGGLFSLKGDLCRHGKPRALRGGVLSEGQNGAQVRAPLPVAARVRCG
jgi:hypothetical protein